MCFFFFKQKTAYEMRISDWSSDVCSSDLAAGDQHVGAGGDRPRRGLCIDAAIDLQIDGAPAGVDLAAQGGDLVQHAGHEALDAEARIHAHAEDEVDIVKHRKIGRASWRERVCQYVCISVITVYLKKKNSTKK